jgi:O-antigen/teichoic acid export membrane protein
MANLKKRFAVNVMMNWAATAVSMVVPFFLTPFVVRHLGTQSYGVWILAVSTVSYLNLLDLGLRSAVIRFVSKAQAQGKLKDASDTIGTALWFRLLLSAGVAVISAFLAFAAPHLFKIPPDLRFAAQITVLFCALGVGITLTTGVFGAVLAAINRFDILSSITMVQTVTRAVGVLLILRSGRGLISLACWDMTVVLLAGLATFAIAWKVFPSCRVRVTRPDMRVLRTIWSYSFTTFIFMIAVQIVINTDSLVIGAFLSVGLVTFYSIGSSLISYSSQVTSAVSTTFTPMASGLEASGRYADLQRLLMRGTQATLSLILPIALALIFRGQTFISLWLGPQYAQYAGISETVLRILTIGLFFSTANSTAGSIIVAIDKHKPLARWAMYEAIFNLGLSIVLVKTVGLYGVAWGTSISMGLVHLLFWPSYINKVLGVPIKTYIWEGWVKITLCSIPFGIMCAIAERYWPAKNLVTFFSQIIVTLPIYAISVAVVFRSEVLTLFHKWQASRPVEV